jgi:Ni,Fe-hydrogenase maturation factor
MKTKIRTNIAILALGTIGFININAVADNKKSVIVDINSTITETVFNESWMTESSIAYSAEAFSYRDVIEEIEKFEAAQILAEEITLKEESLIYSAKAFSDIEFEKEIEEYVAE